MVSLFLHGEIGSDRWKNQILEIIEKHNFNKKIVLSPNLLDENENRQRKRILKIFRGYDDSEIFENFPKKIDWKLAVLNQDDLLKVKYIEYDYWAELSGGTRFAKDSVSTIKNGTEIFGVKNDNFIRLAEHIKSGNSLEPLIIIASNTDSNKMIVLEGHARLTAIHLAIEHVSEIKALIGFTGEEDLNRWNRY